MKQGVIHSTLNVVKKQWKYNRNRLTTETSRANSSQLCLSLRARQLLLHTSQDSPKADCKPSVSTTEASQHPPKEIHKKGGVRDSLTTATVSQVPHLPIAIGVLHNAHDAAANADGDLRAVEHGAQARHAALLLPLRLRLLLGSA